jgi:hypothetical protein
MKHLDLWKEKLRAVKSERIIRQRQYNTAHRAIVKCLSQMEELEKKIEKAKLASIKPSPK